MVGAAQGEPLKQGYLKEYPKALLGHLPALGAPGREPHPEGCPQSRGDITAFRREPPKHWKLRGSPKALLRGGRPPMQGDPKATLEGAPKTQALLGGHPKATLRGTPKVRALPRGCPKAIVGGGPPTQGGSKATRGPGGKLQALLAILGEPPKPGEHPKATPGGVPKAQGPVGGTPHSTPGQGGCLWGCPPPLRSRTSGQHSHVLGGQVPALHDADGESAPPGHGGRRSGADGG